MLFLNTLTNEYPRFQGDLELLGWTSGNTLPEGWVSVSATEIPVYEEGKVIEEIMPQEIDGVWTQQWDIRDETAEEAERRLAPQTAKAKLIALGLTEIEIEALSRTIR